MKRFLLPLVLVLSLAASGCGSDVVIGAQPTDPTPPPVVTSPTPTPTATADPGGDPAAEAQRLAQQESLLTSRLLWRTTRPGSYRFVYTMQCECDQGPWQVDVNANGISTARHLSGGEDQAAPYDSIEAVFDEIEATMNEGRFPVDVEYNGELGYPTTYIFKEPDLPVDGGFVFVLDDFTANPAEDRSFDREQLDSARRLWQRAELQSYDYTFQNSCFCPPEYIGPYEVSVVDGIVAAATYQGRDLLEIETVLIEKYDELILTVDEIFDEIARAIREADSYDVEYHPDLGYPISVFIDWETQMADEESGYTVSNLTELTEPPATPCSTTGAEISLVLQSELPLPVQQRREAIFDAAMACDIAGVAALTATGFNPSFGGGDAFELWTEAEARGEPVMLDLVRHLNLAYAFDDAFEPIYTWPSAFSELEASDGTGLDRADYEALLELYSAAELQDMFENLGGYVGYRIGIDADGSWLFFVAGD